MCLQGYRFKRPGDNKRSVLAADKTVWVLLNATVDVGSYLLLLAQVGHDRAALKAILRCAALRLSQNFFCQAQQFLRTLDFLKP